MENVRGALRSKHIPYVASNATRMSMQSYFHDNSWRKRQKYRPYSLFEVSRRCCQRSNRPDPQSNCARLSPYMKLGARVHMGSFEVRYVSPQSPITFVNAKFEGDAYVFFHTKRSRGELCAPDFILGNSFIFWAAFFLLPKYIGLR